MDEESIRNFWISQEKPKNLPKNWTWVNDMINVSELFSAYKILHPDKEPAIQLLHYICAPWKMKEEVEFWFSNYITENFIYIWRPMFCDPDYEPDIETDFYLDILEDDEDYEEEEDE